MIVDILTMPLERVSRVALDNQHIRGHLEFNERADRWLVYTEPGNALRTQPHSREAAAMLLLFHHFTNERRVIDQREAAEATQAAEKGESSE